MDNIFVIAGIISASYLLFKFAEMRCFEKENKPIKDLVKDAIMVYLSVIAGDFVNKQMQPLGNMIMGDGNTKVFTNNPDF